MRIIVVGCGKVGSTLAEQLVGEGHDITVIDRNEDKIRKLTDRLDIDGVPGNGATYRVQLEADVREADLLIAVTAQDEVNLLCCLIAKKAGNCHTIARVRNPEYAAQSGLLKEDLGLSMTINPEMAAAREISRLLRFPSAVKVDTFAKGRVELLQMHIPADSRLAGLAVCEVGPLIDHNVLICMIERAGEIVIPDGRTLLKAGDLITIIVPPSKANGFFKSLGVPVSRIESAMLVGGGKTSFFLARLLIDAGIYVKIIEHDEKRCEFLSEHLPEASILYGDGTDRELLREEGLATTDCFVSLTDIDEENIMLSLYAGTQSPAKLITKVNRIDFEEVIDQLPVGSVIYPKEITASLISQYVRAMRNADHSSSNVETLYRLHGGAEALEFRVQAASRVTGIPLEQLQLRRNLLVCCINRGGRIITPRGKDTIEVGDTVILVTTICGLNNLTDILSEG